MIIGLDVGGTNIDAVIIANKKIIKFVKSPYEKNSLENDIVKTLNELLKEINPNDIKHVNLSTTISTNAIIENKLPKVGMIIQSGPGVSLSELSVSDNDYFISGYTDHRGIVVKDFIHEEILSIKETFKKDNISTIGIATKFSVRNPKTELEIKKVFENDFSIISLSHELSGQLNFPRRINTTYLNSSIYSIYNNFINGVLKSLKEQKITCPVFILKADGGIINVEESIKSPITTITSGPAASLMGALSLIDVTDDALLIDIGGTTTDIFVFAKGEALFEPLGLEINDYKTLVRSIYNKSIGLGGDSSVNVYNGVLKIGPIRDGKPYSLGGPKVTLTDAFIYLGLLNIGSINKAEKAISIIAKELLLPLKETAEKIIAAFTENLHFEVKKIIDTVNNKPVYTIKELLYQDKIIPKKIYLVGGPAKVLKEPLEKQFNLKCFYPKEYQVINAIGAALSKINGEVNLHVDTLKETLVVPELGLIEKISPNTTLNDVRKLSFKYLEQLMKRKGPYNVNDFQIVFENSFNMLEGYYRKGKNIRIKVQVKPGLIYKLEGEDNGD